MQLRWPITRKEKTNEVDCVPNLKLAAEVVFGVSSQGCRGTGICKITTLSTLEEQNKLMSQCKRALVVISKNLKGRLRFQFKKASMCRNAITENFQFGYFSVNEDFELPYFIQEKLIPYNKVIPQGVYPVIETKDSFTVLF